LSDTEKESDDLRSKLEKDSFEVSDDEAFLGFPINWMVSLQLFIYLEIQSSLYKASSFCHTRFRTWTRFSYNLTLIQYLALIVHYFFDFELKSFL
jgi:hypothetical protein